MSNIQYTHTAVLPSQFNANGTNLHWAKLQSSEVCELIKQNNNNCLVGTTPTKEEELTYSYPSELGTEPVIDYHHIYLII